jgi:hypothetical protein
MLRTLYTKEGLSYEYGPRVVSVFRGTQEIIPFLRRFVNLEERLIYQGTRLRPEYSIIPFPVDHESLSQLPCGQQIVRELAEIEGAKSPPAEGNLRDYLESTVGPTLTSPGRCSQRHHRTQRNLRIITRTKLPAEVLPPKAFGEQWASGLSNGYTTFFLSPAYGRGFCWGAGPVLYYPATSATLGVDNPAVKPPMLTA